MFKFFNVYFIIMAAEHSIFDPSSFYMVTYGKKGTGSVSYLSQCMRDWIHEHKAIRGRIRGEYYIRGEVGKKFEEVANSIKAVFTVIEVSGEEVAHLSKIFRNLGISIPTSIEGKDGIPQHPIPEDLPDKIAGINETLQRIETKLKTDGGEKETAPNPSAREQDDANKANRQEWQVVLQGFALYQEIYEEGMANPKTQQGLIEALKAVSKQHGVSDKEILKQMDVAFEIAKRCAGTEQ